MQISKSTLSKVCLLAGSVFTVHILLATDVVIRKDNEPSSTPTPVHGSAIILPVLVMMDNNVLVVYFDDLLGDVTIIVYDAQNEAVYQNVVDSTVASELYIPVSSWGNGYYTIRITYGTTHLIGGFQL